MAHPAINTKIEIVVEAIEDLALAAGAHNHEEVVEARKRCGNALREFLQPTLRVVGTDDHIS